MELTHDLPLDGLVSEVKAIKDSIQMLEDKLDNARCVGGWVRHFSCRSLRRALCFSGSRKPKTVRCCYGDFGPRRFQEGSLFSMYIVISVLGGVKF